MKSSQISTKTTKSYSSIGGAAIKPIAGPRTLVINRTGPGQSMGGVVREVEMRRSFGTSSGGAGMGSANSMHTGVETIVHGREKEKKDMRELNERFANYIEKVRFLEAQNKKLSNELATLRERWGKETERIKQMYDVEMAQLRKLLDESEKAKAELEIRIHSYEEQINDLQAMLDSANQQHVIDRETIDKLNQQLSEYESEISLLRRRIGSFEADTGRDKAEVNRLRDEVRRLRMDLDQETLSHINAENEAQSLRDEIEFMKQVHESEMKELASLAYRDTTKENREFWKSEMSQALHDIQNEYDSKMDAMRGEMETHYNLKIQEHRTTSSRGSMEMTHTKEENSRLKSQLSELRDRIPQLEAKNAQLERLLEEIRRDMEERSRDFELERNSLRKSLSDNQAELEAVLMEMQALLDAKLSLELEIAAYRKLLECEETRTGLRSLVEQTMDTSEFESATSGRMMESSMMLGGGGGGGGAGRSSMSMNMSSSKSTSGGGIGGGASSAAAMIKGEMSAKTTYQRTAKGNVSIQECSPDGKFITIENTGKRREEISGMRITRNVDNNRQMIRFTFPDKTTLDSEGRAKSIKIWARGHRPAGATNDLECTETSWGNGANIHTVLLNNEGDEKATHTQRTVYQAN